ncbi:MAG: phage head spike fiber domain-containing protein [Desulfuromonadaceae bacterium]
MTKKKSSGVGKIIPERIMDWSGGQNNAVNVALLNENESRLLQNYSLDEKGTLFPFPGSLKRYAADMGTSPAAGLGKFYKSDGTSKFLIGLEDGKLYVDSPHLVNQYDTQADFNGGGNFAVQADAGGKLWPMIIKDGFESGLFDDWHTRDAGWTIDTVVFKTGAKSAKGTGTTQKLIREFGMNAGQLYIKMAVRFAEANQLHYPVILISPTSTEIQAIVADTDGHFKYHTGTALANFPTDKTYAANTWYIVEVWVRGGTYWVSIDGVGLTPSGLTMKDTADAAQTQASKLQIQNAGATSATTYVDDIELNLLAPVPSRASVAYKQDGTQVAANAPRYEAVGSVQGVMVEEGTTNLLTANQASVETDTTGFVAVSGSTLSRTVAHWHGAACLKIITPGAAASEGFRTDSVAVTASQPYAASIWLTGSGSVRLVLQELDAANSNIGFTDSVNLSLTSSWQRLTVPRTFGVNGVNARLYVQTNTQAAVTFYADGLQLESKANATSFQLPGIARAAETLTIPTTGVFNKGNWTIELTFTPTSQQVVSGRFARFFDITIDANNYYRSFIGPSGTYDIEVASGGVVKTIADSTPLTVGVPVSIMFSGNGSVLRLCKNGAQIGSDLAYAEPIGSLPSTIYLGCGLGGAYQANGIFSDVRFSSRDRTLAEHQAYVASGLPITLDADTTLLMSANGNLNISTTHHWLSPVIDCSNATDKSSGHLSLTSTTPGASTVAAASRSAPASTGPWTAWVAALGDGSLQHVANNYVQIKLTLTRDGENDPYVDKITVSFDGQATATLLASDFSPGKQFFFDQLNDLLAVMTGDAPRKYDGTTLAAMGGSPPHAPYGVAHKNRFWMAKGSRLYFSDLLNIESWPVLNFIDIMPNDGDEITGMITFGDYLVIAKGHSVWLLIGETINTFRVRRIHSDRGCYAPRSLCIVNQMLCFVSDDGIYFSDFTQPVLISERIRKTWDGLNKRRLNLIASWFYDHKLYVAVPDAGQQRNTRVIVYDSLRQAFAGDRIWPVSCWTDFREAGEINSFYGRSDLGNVRKIDAGHNDDGVAYEAIYESMAISHGAAEILKRYNIGYLQIKPAALDAELIISFIVDGVETPTMTVTVPANATGLIDTLQIFASAVGVVSGHRIQIKIRQMVLDNPLGIQSVYLEALPLLIAPTLRG